jgi:ABC-type dipeptide/oligopeptide/nickel transport system permease component/ABC-type transport system substrate-binding protein
MKARTKLVLLVLLAASASGMSREAAAQDPLVLGVPLEPPNLDPTSGAAAAVDSVVYGNIFEGLVRITQSGDVAPALAESWDVSADGLVYTFRLRRGVRFHDGTSFDANDVKFSFDRALAPDSTNAQKALLSAISDVDVFDTHTVRLTLSRPSSSLLYFLGWGDAVIVAEESAAGNANNPVGTGPFRFSDWRRGVSIRLERNRDYWGVPARPGSVVFRIIGDPAAAYAAMKAGDLDAYPNYPAPENVAEFERDLNFKVVIGATAGKVIMAMNNGRPPFDDPLVRAAVSHAIDRDAVIDGAMFGYGEPIGSHYSRQDRAWIDLTGRYPHDVGRARDLLAQAGYPDGFSVTLRLPPRPYARRSGEVIAAQLARAGIRVEIENLEWAQWLDQVFSRREFDLTIIEHIEPMDFGIYARDDYYFGYADPAFKALVAGYEAATDDVTRDDFLRRIQAKIADDAVNVFLVQSAQIGIWKAGLNGLWVDTPIPANIASAAYFEGGGATAGDGQTRAGPGRSIVVPAVGAVLIVLLLLTMRLMGAAWLLERLASHAGTLLAATVVIFVVLQIVPGDPAAYMMGMNASPESIASLRAQMGLDAPPLERYLGWLGGLATGRFGTSYTYMVPVGDLIVERLAVSLPLAVLAIVLSLIVALPAGVLAASRRGRFVDTALNAVMQVGVAMPNFWIGLLLILVFSTQLRWFAAGGFVGWDAGFLPALRDLLLPAIALAAPQAAITARVLRTALLETMNEDYVRTARAKGLSRRQALWRHALRNAMIPVLTIIGLQLPFLLAGGIIIENVFSLPGIGRLVFQAITQRDLIVVQNVVFVLVFAVVTVTFFIDVAYSIVDPRLRSSAR